MKKLAFAFAVLLCLAGCAPNVTGTISNSFVSEPAPCSDSYTGERLEKQRSLQEFCYLVSDKWECVDETDTTAQYTCKDSGLVIKLKYNADTAKEKQAKSNHDYSELLRSLTCDLNDMGDEYEQSMPGLEAQAGMYNALGKNMSVQQMTLGNKTDFLAFVLSDLGILTVKVTGKTDETSFYDARALFLYFLNMIEAADSPDEAENHDLAVTSNYWWAELDQSFRLEGPLCCIPNSFVRRENLENGADGYVFVNESLEMAINVIYEKYDNGEEEKLKSGELVINDDVLIGAADNKKDFYRINQRFYDSVVSGIGILSGVASNSVILESSSDSTAYSLYEVCGTAYLPTGSITVRCRAAGATGSVKKEVQNFVLNFLNRLEAAPN